MMMMMTMMMMTLMMMMMMMSLKQYVTTITLLILVLTITCPINRVSSILFLAIRCPLVRVSNANPPYGVCSSAPYVPRYKTRCSFKCDRGYRLKGSKERVCQLDKTWSGIPTICEGIGM